MPPLQLGDDAVIVLAVELVEAHDDEDHNGETQQQVQVHILDGIERGGDLRGRSAVVTGGTEDERRNAAADEYAELVLLGGSLSLDALLDGERADEVHSDADGRRRLQSFSCLPRGLPR